jgi:nucleoside 2-deoxyribosyltransferase
MTAKKLPKRSVYFAAPLFTPEERQFNSQMATLLERQFRVFLPQRDGHLIPGRILTPRAYSRVAKQVFKADVAELRSADLVFAVLNGRTIDEGVAFELGFAYAHGIDCIGYSTDSRVLLPTGPNPMVTGALSLLIKSREQFNRWLTAI